MFFVNLIAMLITKYWEDTGDFRWNGSDQMSSTTDQSQGRGLCNWLRNPLYHYYYYIIIIPLHHYYTIYTLHIMEIVNKLWNYEIGFNSSNTHPAG